MRRIPKDSLAGKGKTSAAHARIVGRPGRAHFVGLCGVGMAGLAYLLKSRGWEVDGCDGSPGSLAPWLRARGVRVREGHNASHIRAGLSLVVRTAAVRADSEELAAARRMKIPVLSRGEVLPLLLDKCTGIAVGGTHGKTTTTSFITRMLRAAGRDPSWCIGGENPGLNGVAGAGAGEELVVEADESDGTLALYHPEIAVVTNVDFDHMDHFAGVPEFEACFLRFMSNARKCVVYCSDDARATSLARRCGRSTVGYGFGSTADVRGVDVKLGVEDSSFSVVLYGRPMGRISISVPGVHNVSNALAALAVGFQLGIPFGVMSPAMRRFALPRRRFERVVDSRDLTVISDYSHHPAEVAALVRTAVGLPHKRLIGVFQPHRYTRTRALGPEFPGAFDGLDRLVLTPVYAASEEPLAGGSVWDLYAHFRSRKPADGRTPDVVVASSLEQAWDGLRRELRAGDVLLVIGAGSVERLAKQAAAEFRPRAARRRFGLFRRPFDPSSLVLRGGTRLRRDVPLGRLTTYGVGGAGEWYAEPASEGDLSRLLSWAARRKCPVRVLGAGSNVLVPDTGVGGLTLRLRGAAFCGVTMDGEEAFVGAGVPLAVLLGKLEKAGLGGMEFLDGIPGTVGGALRMNAGAYGHAIAGRVVSIQCLNPDGSRSSVRRETMEAGYRRCVALEGRIATSVRLRLWRSDAAAIREERAKVRAKKEWMRGLRCAGSVFRNPPGDYAGRLLEVAGLKGASVGGAFVSERHANVIVTGPDARASDVRTLMERMRWAVEERFGVRLESEVVLFGEG